jgi:uncharacterized zinc-type alcohol dehydrogenase-like protein
MLAFQQAGCIAGSAIGGIRETQEMLDFCAEHAIIADIKMAAVEPVATVCDRIVASDGDTALTSI